MFLGSLGFVLVLSYAGELHAQSSPKDCQAPQLEGGFLLPQLEIYSHGSRLAYACNTGYRPPVESWWDTSECFNGSWTHTPQCIDENACLPPNIPNGKCDPSPEGSLYNDGSVVRIKCDEGYEHKLSATATCQKGAWSDLPSCERASTTSDMTDGDSTRSPIFIAVDNCGSHPHIPNGDVVQKSAMFLRYECSAFYKMIGPKTVMCYSDGTWSPLPTCKEAFCKVDFDVDKSSFIQESGVIFLKEGEVRRVQCILPRYFSQITCMNGKERVTQCCHFWDHENQRCS
ncbi:coagulation factor XIII B chain-like [Festucalex cinctus]